MPSFHSTKAPFPHRFVSVPSFPIRLYYLFLSVSHSLRKLFSPISRSLKFSDRLSMLSGGMDGAQDAAAAAAAGNAPPPFLSKTYDMVDDPSTDTAVSWTVGGNSFVVWNVPEFARDLLPKFFKHSNFSSFVRQLNTYGFKKVDPDRWEFANEGFLKGQKSLLKTISRRKPVNVQNHQTAQSQVQSTSVRACVEVGKFGLEKDVERLRRDKNILMQELVRLRQQQQATDNQLQTVGQRVQVMEQRQRQIMSFLAKAMQRPGFLAQLVQQQGESNRCISRSNKKRRLPKQGKDGSAGEPASVAPDGQIVKYQPQMNEAAKAMLRQILKINSSARLESSVSNPDAFLIDDVPLSSTALDSESSSSRISEVMLTEALPTSGQASLSAESQFPVTLGSAAISEAQSSSNAASAAQLSGLSALNHEEDTVFPDFSGVQAMLPESDVEIPSVNFVRSEVINGCYTDPAGIENMMAEGDGFPLNPDPNFMVDGITKLPSVNDTFWEQFLTSSPIVGDTDEINSQTMEGDFVHEREEHLGEGWEGPQHLNQVTEQMGLLSSSAGRA